MAFPKGAVEKYLEDLYGGHFRTIERVVAVGVNAAVLLKANPERVGFVVVNTGGIQITLRTSRVLTAGKGLIVAQAGDTLSATIIEDGMFPTSELNAIASVASGELYVLEFIREG